MIKKYYKIEFKLISPLSVGSGENEFSDKDIIKKSNGMPFIPGTSLAGVYRSLFEKDIADLYFGPLLKEGAELKDSCILVYDATLMTNIPIVTKRDGVALDQYKVAKKSAKYDFEVLEPGIKFVTYLEQNITDEVPEDISYALISRWKQKGMKFGSKTARGYGETKIERVWKKAFDFNDNEKVENWLDFNMYEESAWMPSDELSSFDDEANLLESDIRIDLELKQNGPISIRKYTTRVNTENEPEPDYEQMAYARKEGSELNYYPYIPGTSWAGAFRHHMQTVAPEIDLSQLFGYLGKKSPIVFHESVIQESVSKMITRNAIDRFGGGTENGALYTERTYYNGNTDLIIEILSTLLKELKNNANDIFNTFAIAVADLHLGILSLGGLTAVGRGLFEVKSITISKGKSSETIKIDSDVHELPEEQAKQIFDFILNQLQH